MKTYRQSFDELKQKNQGALVAFTVIGDPDYKTSLRIVKTIVDAGADMLELGIAFSDPIADGPTIQSANIRAISSGMNTQRAFEFVNQVRKFTQIPIGFLCYYNLIYQRGIEKFYDDCKQAGVNSVLVADMPIEEFNEVSKYCKGIDTVFMISPLTGDDRIKKIASNVTGFIYAVSRLGVTGAKKELEGSTIKLIRRIKSITQKPLCVGFGISSPSQVGELIKEGANGAIVGSAISSLIEKNLKNKNKMLDDISSYIKCMKKATE